MAKRKRTALVKLNNLPLLQNLIRRDPPSYREEFLLQYRHYESQRDIFMEQPDGHEGEAFAELVGFMAQVCSSFPDLTAQFPNDLATLLMTQHDVLHPELREKLVQCLVLLRNKDVISSSTLLQTLFPILTVTKSKGLRSQIYTTIISEMRNANAKSKNHKLNKTIQTVLFGLVELGKDDPASTAGLWAVKLTRELWRRNVWDDSRTVEIMKEAALSSNPKVMVGGAKFFLGVDQEREDAEDSDYGENIDVGKLKYAAGINKTNKKKKQLEKAMAVMKRKEKSKNKPNPLNFSALHLLRDPQGFAEALFSKHLSKQNTKLTLEQKLVVLQLVSRLVGLHKLELLQMYSYLLKYLTPRQRDVTQFLICAAQASHDLVPPDVLEPIVQKIANEFVSDGVASEVATAGLNSIREICTRAPLAMNATLLQDLTEYKGSKDKGVMMAARSLIGLYREIAPELLKKKDRGKTAAMGIKGKETLRFGEEKNGEIEGLELLEAWKEEQRLKKLADAEENGEVIDEDAEEDDEDDEAGWEGWEVEEDDDSDEEGWIAVSSDEEIDISDSETEKPTKKAKLAKVAEEKSEEKEPENKTEENDTPDALQTEEEKAQEAAAEEARKEERRINNLATNRILTPADFAKLAELRLQAGLDKLTGKKIDKPSNANEDSVTADAIQSGNLKRGKASKEARLATVLEGRKDREKYGSRKGNIDKPHSTTNKEKARKKNFLMTLGTAKRKQRMSLVDKKKVLQAHVKKQKMKKK